MPFLILSVSFYRERTNEENIYIFACAIFNRLIRRKPGRRTVQRVNDSAKKGKQFNAGEGSTNCSSFAIKRRTCIPLEYNRGSCLEKKVASTWLPVSRVFSCQLVAVQWKKPISPVANGWLEVVGRSTGGSGWRGKNKKKKKI